MIRVLAILISLSIILDTGCVQNRTSGIEKLRKKYSKDPIESMRFAEKRKKPSSSGSPKKLGSKKDLDPSKS